MKLLHGRGIAPPVVTNRNEEQGARDSAILVSAGEATVNRIELMKVPLTAKAIPGRLEGQHVVIRMTNHVSDNVYTVGSVRFATFNGTCR
jgi:hypothetical protein